MWTITQRVAYINTQVACMLAELEGMKAVNHIREMKGESLAFDDRDFMRLQDKYQFATNDVIQYLQAVTE